MTTLAIVLIILAAVVLLAFIGGLLGARRRDKVQAPDYERHLREADHALEQARASDRGWDRAMMEEVVRDALARDRPDIAFDRLELVLVDDRPGVEEDRAHFEATSSEGRVLVVLARGEAGWIAEPVV